MAESLPVPRALYRIKGGADDSWEEAVDGQFQASPNVEYEICCVKPSEFATQVWAPSVIMRYVDSVNGNEGGTGFVSDPWKYLPGQASSLHSVLPGTVIYAMTGSVWNETLAPVDGCIYRAYGEGTAPTIDVSAVGGATGAVFAVDVDSFEVDGFVLVGSGGMAPVRCQGSTGSGGYLARFIRCDISNNSALGLDTQHDGVSTDNTAQIYVEDCTIHDCYRADGATDHQAVTAHGQSSIQVVGGSITDCSIGFQNVASATTSAYGVTITGTISKVIDSSVPYPAHITLDSCDINVGDAAVLIKSASSGDQTQEITIKNSSILITSVPGVHFIRGVNLLLQNNTITFSDTVNNYNVETFSSPCKITSTGNTYNIVGLTSTSGLFEMKVSGDVFISENDTFVDISDTFLRTSINPCEITFNYPEIRQSSDELLWISSGFAGSAVINNATIYNSASGTIFDNDMDAGDSGTLAITNSIFHTVTTPLQGVEKTTLSNNIYFNSGNIGGANALTSDPLLSDPANGDFTLQPGSPAINTGIDVGLTSDHAGNPIVGLPDRGAYEYVS